MNSIVNGFGRLRLDSILRFANLCVLVSNFDFLTSNFDFGLFSVSLDLYWDRCMRVQGERGGCGLVCYPKGYTAGKGPSLSRMGQLFSKIQYCMSRTKVQISLLLYFTTLQRSYGYCVFPSNTTMLRNKPPQKMLSFKSLKYIFTKISATLHFYH